MIDCPEPPMKINFRIISVASAIIIQVAVLPAFDMTPEGKGKILHSDSQKDSLASVWLERSVYYSDKNADSVLFCCNEGLKYAGPDNPELYVGLLTNIAEARFSLGEMDESIRAHLHAYSEAARLGCSAGIRSSLLASIGLSWKRKAELDSALHYYNRAVDLLDGEDGVSSELCHVLTNIAALYVSYSRLDEAEAYAREAVEVSDEDTDPDDVIYAYSTVGAILAKKGNYEESVKILREALAKARKLGQPKYELKVLTYILAMFNYTGERDSVEFYDREAVILMRNLPENLPEVLGYKETEAKVFASVGKYSESNRILSELLASSGKNEQSAPDILWLCMARNYMAMNMFAEASSCYENAISASDSLRDDAIQSQLSEWSVKYDTRVKDLEISRLETDRIRERSARIQWLMTAVILMLASVAGLIYYVFWSRGRKRYEELMLARKYIEGLEKERLRIAEDLHDGVCNDLLGIGLQMKAISRKGECEAGNDIIEMIEKLRADVRYISHELMPPEFRFASLDEIMDSYVGKFSAHSEISFRFEKSADGNEWRNIPDNISYETYRIFQELLSNIVRHSGARNVDIILRLNRRMLSLDFDSDGTAKLPETVRGGRNTKGIGMSVIRERVKSIGATLSFGEGDFGQHFSLSVPLYRRRQCLK